MQQDFSFAKVALFGGVYNNHLALWKACELATAHGCEALFQLGDLGGFGPYPNKVFPVLKEFNVRCIQGNYEESLISCLSDCGCGYTHPKDNHYAQISYDYTNHNLSEENRQILSTFPKQLQFKLTSFPRKREPSALPSGKVLDTRLRGDDDLVVHLCHGSPRRVNEFLWETTTADGFIAKLSRDLGFDILCCTHTGLPWKREVAPNKWIVNVGVLGRPANDGRQNVWYTELAWENGRPQIDFIEVHYDWKTLAGEMRAEKLPEEFVETIETGWWTTCLEILPGKERMQGRF